jgi:ATP adenylyltransferase
MDHLWSPWRYKYIAGIDRQEGCVFCRARDNPDDAQSLVVHRGFLVYAILNLFPYTSGHLMIVPYRHTASFVDLDEAATAEMFQLAKRAAKALHEEYHPEGYNIGMNLGRAAGAGVAEHIHLHVVPRWTGDANFVSVVGETRVVSEDLSVTRTRLSRHFNQ